MVLYTFFLISNKDVYSKILPHAENHRAEIRSTEKDDKKQKEKILITKKGVKEHRERITRCESPSPKPVKQRATKRSKQLVFQTIHVLKSPPIMLPPNRPQ